MKNTAIALAVGALLLTGSTARAGVLYGLSSGSPGVLYTIDQSTGAATAVVAVSNLTSLVGIEFLGGKLYATDVLDGSFKFGTIDLVTGQFTAINNQGGSANWWGLAASEKAGLLYAIDFDDTTLKSVTASGVITTIGSGTGIVGSGMAFDDANGILYATSDDGGLYRVDTTTGTSTLIGATGIYTGMAGLAFDSEAGILYANSGAGALYRLDTTTGAATLVGANGVGNIDGLAFQSLGSAVPEPASMSLLAAGAVGMIGYRLRRRKTGTDPVAAA